ncbi:dephospho-CoA kinase [Flavobacteriaceae bacterium D16]|nr:dephospho-CoA kinase [Flavobacteriaceae bacterium D16]
MKLVGLTGGIGSGKTTVSEMFSELGVPVYNSDQEAKRLMNSSEELKGQIIKLLGDEAYKEGELQRRFIAERVFSEPDLLQQLNAIVHPAVKKDFYKWALYQEYPYLIQEAAILFENGSHDSFDKMILVTAPVEERISRIQKRDGSTREAILERIQNQWEDSRKIQLANYVIENINLPETREQVMAIHAELLEL